MANTTVTGAKAIHGQNPQVRLFMKIRLFLSLIFTVSSRDCHSKPHIRSHLLEGALLCVNWYASQNF